MCGPRAAEDNVMLAVEEIRWRGQKFALACDGYES
jgi:hypothetical protein